MTISLDIRQQIRRRANFACEFCGVTEADTAGELTIDHYRPKAKGGNDALDNLVYCCSRCNQYKSDYWPLNQDDTPIWNPRNENAKEHFWELNDGRLHPLTVVGAFTIQRLRLNRKPLVSYRLRRMQRAEEVKLLTRYEELVELLDHLNKQLATVMEEQQSLLQEQRELIELLLEQRR